jgi:hypothetical protein
LAVKGAAHTVEASGGGDGKRETEDDLARLTLSAEACTMLRDAAAARVVYDQLVALARGTSGTHAVLCVQPVSFYLALLASTMGRTAEAQSHFTEALKAVEALGLRRRRVDLAHGAAGWSSAETAENVFRHEGDFWTLAYAGRVCRIRDAKGLRHVAFLIRHRGLEFHVRQLLAETDGRGSADGGSATSFSEGLHVSREDGGPLLDTRARVDYRKRLEDLRGMLAEAEDHNDLGRAEAARAEMDLLACHLAAAFGLGGRRRRAASASERARLTVTKRIKDVVRKLRVCHPPLARHLCQAIKTGYYCTYAPDQEAPPVWIL